MAIQTENILDTDDFTFLDAPADTIEPEDIPPTAMAKMSPRQLAHSVIEVYQKLGGTEWLLKQAMVDPKSFFDLIKKVIPTNIKVDGLEALTVNLVNAYVQGPGGEAIPANLNNADVIDLEDRRHGIKLLAADGTNEEDLQRLADFGPADHSVEIATGGNQEVASPPERVQLKDSFSPPDESVAAGGNTNFEFS